MTMERTHAEIAAEIARRKADRVRAAGLEAFAPFHEHQAAELIGKRPLVRRAAPQVAAAAPARERVWPLVVFAILGGLALGGDIDHLVALLRCALTHLATVLR
ncbi:MAG TPA: hypothetical protein VGT42_04625 [Gammaproteobacteria bacterium]|nr:hypothetical protein [Gammaproteobacteria bacterium]